MPTCVLYIDETGHPDKHDIPLTANGSQSPLFCLAGVAFLLDDWRAIDREYLRQKQRYFKKEITESKQRPEHWEAKALCAPRNAGDKRSQAFLVETLDILVRFQAKTFGVTFLKNHKNPTPAETLYTMGLQHLAERFNTYVYEHPGINAGIMVADRRQHRLDLGVGASYLSYIFGHETGKQLTSLQEGPLFAHSNLTACLQIAHTFASVVAGNHYHYYCRSIQGALDYSHLQQYWPRLDDLQFRSKSQYEGRLVYGYKIHDFREEQS